MLKDRIYFIGIDISKSKLDMAVTERGHLLFHQIIRNQPEAIRAFLSDLSVVPGFELSRAVFCMEQTGIYNNHVLEVLHSCGAGVISDNALKIKNSSGLVRGKTDKSDAAMIARYGYTQRENLCLWEPRRQVVQYLANLSALRTRLVSIQTAITTPLEENKEFIPKSFQAQNERLCNASRKGVKADLIRIEKQLKKLIAGDPRIRRLVQIITSVPGVGPVTAVYIIICTNEFISIRYAKKFASYAGIAPFTRASGRVTRKATISQIANKKMKSLLHICAVAAMKCEPDLKAYYQRKTLEGKHKMAVINALRNKLVLRVFTCVHQDRVYRCVKAPDEK